MKRIISILLILAFLLSVTGSVSAIENDTKKIENVDLVERYSVQFQEMENEIKGLEVSLNKTDMSSLTNVEAEDKILTRTIYEGSDLITLVIPYSVIMGIDITVTKTHAKLYAKSTWEEENNWATLKNVQGRVLEYYDGATCPKIEFTAGQYCNWTPLSNRSEDFIEYKDNYTQDFDWPQIGLVPGSSWVVDLGHTVYFTIKRGTVTNVWQVVCNKQLQFTN